MSTLEKLQTRCAIIGSGPAGMMAGYLLARAGVPVAVLEKHGDFNRDFRGDTIHPSTLELMHELGLLDEFLKQPHQEVQELRGVINGQTVPIADFTRLPTRCKFIAFMPQWDFLNFLSSHAKRFRTFQLLMQTEVVDLLIENERVIGVRAKTPRGEIELRADLVIGADGRHSTTHTRAGFKLREFGVPIDVLWMRISKKQDDPEQSFGFFQHGKRRWDQSCHPGCGRDGEFTRGKIAERSGHGGRSAKSTGTTRMADAADSARASIHSSLGCHWPSVRREELIAVCRSFAEMVSVLTAVASSLYRSRPAARALP